MEQPRVEATRDRSGFYRPELDLLRLLAFLLVFSLHGPRLTESGLFVAQWKTWVGYVFNRLALAGQAGLPLFFFLSSYLITELLLREKDRTGTLHLKAFYIRRLLRIWPLYFAGLVLGIAVGLWKPAFRLGRHDILYLTTFTGWLGETFHGNPFGVLWSISLEEWFYLIWPSLAKRGKTFLTRAAFVIIPLAPLTLKLFHHGWYNPVTHFVFFATGGLVALVLQKRTWTIPAGMRIPIFLTGMVSFAGVRFVDWNESLVYFVLDLGCVLVFFAVLGLHRRYLPAWALYLGKISYGLYVFHLAVYVLITPRLLRPLHLNSEIVSLLLTYGLTLTLTVAIAAASYAYFETPFLRLKKRFEFVRSRPA